MKIKVQVIMSLLQQTGKLVRGPEETIKYSASQNN